MPEQFRTAYRENSRAQFFEILRARYWSAEERRSNPIETRPILDASDVVEQLANEALGDYQVVRQEILSLLEMPTHRQRVLAPHEPRQSKYGLLVPTSVLGTLDAHIERWADRWNLTPNWCIEVAFRTLERWTVDPETLDAFEWSRSDYAFGFARKRFEIKEWSGRIPISEYRKWGRGELIKQFNQYCDGLDREAAAAQVPTKASSHTPEAYCWAVRSQVLDRSFSEIAEGADRESSTVRRTVNSLLDFLGIPRRPHEEGRPTGSKDRTPRRHTR